jgi:hypothetical protein
MRESKGSKMRKFGPHVDKVPRTAAMLPSPGARGSPPARQMLELINGKYASKFRQKPLGPLGSLIRLKDPSKALAIQSAPPLARSRARALAPPPDARHR